MYLLTKRSPTNTRWSVTVIKLAIKHHNQLAPPINIALELSNTGSILVNESFTLCY